MKKADFVRLKKKYPFVVIWGQQTGSLQYYIAEQLAKAERDDAPFNAIYERHGTWSTVDDINEDGRTGYKLDMAYRAVKLLGCL